MSETNNALLDKCIDICAEFEKQTGMKTREIHAFSQKDLSQKTGLTIQNIKKWRDATRAAQDIVSTHEAARDQ